MQAITCIARRPSLTGLLPGLVADTEIYKIIRTNSKIIVDYSVITVLHWFLHNVPGHHTFYTLSAISELCEPKTVDHEAYIVLPLAFCVENLFRAVETPESIGQYRPVAYLYS